SGTWGPARRSPTRPPAPSTGAGPARPAPGGHSPSGGTPVPPASAPGHAACPQPCTRSRPTASHAHAVLVEHPRRLIRVRLARMRPESIREVGPRLGLRGAREDPLVPDGQIAPRPPLDDRVPAPAVTGDDNVARLAGG